MNAEEMNPLEREQNTLVNDGDTTRVMLATMTAQATLQELFEARLRGEHLGKDLWIRFQLAREGVSGNSFIYAIERLLFPDNETEDWYGEYPQYEREMD